MPLVNSYKRFAALLQLIDFGQRKRDVQILSCNDAKLPGFTNFSRAERLFFETEEFFNCLNYAGGSLSVPERIDCV